MSSNFIIRDRALDWATAGLSWEVRVSQHQSMMPSGRNGPYLDLESPMRNSAHWVTTFSIAYALSGDERFRDIGERLANFLVHSASYRLNGATVHRQKSPKDWCNGVIGQAWIVEGLHRAGKHLGLQGVADAARELASQLPFDSRYSAWRRVDPVGGELSVDFTYNHQSWFAAARAEVLGGDDSQVQAFLDGSLEGNFGVNERGVIRHVMGNRPSKRSPSAIVAALQKRWEMGNRKAAGGIAVEPVERGEGYHLYVLHSLARLYRATDGRHGLFESDGFRRALRLAADRSFFSSLEDNHFAYPYNGPGFEYPLIVDAFSEIEPGLNKELAQMAIEAQERKTLCRETGLFSIGTDDSVTLAARAYELMLGLEPVSVYYAQ